MERMGQRYVVLERSGNRPYSYNKNNASCIFFLSMAVSWDVPRDTSCHALEKNKRDIMYVG